jgi:DNA-binding CsgD family transcriptional regulator/PAS domain-containing protein
VRPCLPSSDLVERIYAAAVDASQWQSALDEIVEVLHARRGVLMLFFAEREDFNVLRMSGWTPNEVELYFSRYASIDVWRMGAARWPEGKVGTDRDLCSREEAEASEAYREFYAPKGAAHGCGTSILAGPYGHSMLTIMRSLEDGPFEESELAILRGLTAHLKRAALLHSELGSLRTQLATFTSHLERSLHPFLLTDPELRVLYENARARELAALGQVVIIESSRLRLASARLDRRLRQITVKMNGSCNHDLEWLEVPRGADQMPLRMLILKAQHSGAIPLGVSQPSFAIQIVDGDSGGALNPEVLERLFGFTPSEARVAAKLAVGRSLEEIAAETRTSVETVRTHLKRALSKTGTRRQGELISLILRSFPFRI